MSAYRRGLLRIKLTCTCYVYTVSLADGDLQQHFSLFVPHNQWWNTLLQFNLMMPTSRHLLYSLSLLLQCMPPLLGLWSTRYFQISICELKFLFDLCGLVHTRLTWWITIYLITQVTVVSRDQSDCARACTKSYAKSCKPFIGMSRAQKRGKNWMVQ